MRTMNETTQTRHVPDWTLGWRLRRALEHAGIDAQDMATELGVHRGTLTRWTHDIGATPRAAYISQWALICGVPVEWLRDDKEVCARQDSNLQPSDPKCDTPVRHWPAADRRRRQPTGVPLYAGTERRAA